MYTMMLSCVDVRASMHINVRVRVEAVHSHNAVH